MIKVRREELRRVVIVCLVRTADVKLCFVKSGAFIFCLLRADNNCIIFRIFMFYLQ